MGLKGDNNRRHETPLQRQGSESASSTHANRIEGIDFLRGISIIVVLLTHINQRIPIETTSAGQWIPWFLFSAIFRSGYLGVVVFFVISGFLITSTSLARWKDLQSVDVRKFYSNRFARIAPPLVATLLVLSILHYLRVPGFVVDSERTSLAQVGRLNEYLTADLYSNSRDPRALNMDLWNNAVGRKHGKTTRNRDELLKMIHVALKKGELITRLDDPRSYTGAQSNPENASKPVVVLAEDKNGRNELFLDVIKRRIFDRGEFISSIQSGEYTGYTLKEVKGVLTPVSNPDSRQTNNLG
jgi:hypothetical protein